MEHTFSLFRVQEYPEDVGSTFLQNVGTAQLQCDGKCTEDNFPVWALQTSPYSLTADKTGRQFTRSSLLAACFCLTVAYNELTHSTALLHPSLSLIRTGLCHHIVIKLYLPNYMASHHGRQ